MRFLIPISLTLIATTNLTGTCARAAEIGHEPLSKGIELITIDGDIEPGDEDKFRKLSLAYDSAAVTLNSNGGSLLSAIEIGKLVRIRSFATFVAGGSTCTSACALIWLAGSKRFLSERGRLGFHASYLEEHGKLEESGVGNALVGHYLSLLNLSEKAVVFTTLASPTEIRWLNLANRAESGIDFENFEEDAATPSKSAPSSPPPLVASTSYGPDWWFIGWTGQAPNRMVDFMDRRSIVRSGNVVKAWKFVFSETPKSSREKKARVLERYGCADHTATLLEYVALDGGSNVLSTDTWETYEQKAKEVQPGTMGEDLWNFACNGPNSLNIQVSPLKVSVDQAAENLLRADR